MNNRRRCIICSSKYNVFRDDGVCWSCEVTYIDEEDIHIESCSNCGLYDQLSPWEHSDMHWCDRCERVKFCKSCAKNCIRENAICIYCINKEQYLTVSNQKLQPIIAE